MKNRNKCIGIGVFILVLSLMIVNFVSSEMLISDVGVQYDSEIIESLENQSSVRIIVELNSSISQDVTDLIKNEIISNLPPSEFILKQNIGESYWFSGEITKEGLEKLILNENIVRIYPPVKGNVTNILCGDGICSIGENCKICAMDCLCSEQEVCIKEKCELKKIINLKNLIWLVGMIVLIILFLAVIIYFIKKIYLKKKREDEK